jgi:4-amino-4-deoxy-L-arabinose transferase-like glycosyltransferase
MKSNWRTNAGECALLLAILCIALWLLLANLGNQYLWDDEAQTALVSKTILTESVPRGYDGKNFFSQEDGAEYGKNYIWKWHTWLPFYVLAGFYKIFGVNTFVSRLPFALFGFGTILSVYFFAKSLWPGTRIPVIAAGLLTISVPFLLLCRQCRYYSMTMFFSVLSLHAYVLLLEKKKYAALMLFVTYTLLFHSQHFYVIVILATTLLHTVIFRRDRLKDLLIAITAVVLVNGPWLVWFAGIKYHKPDGVRLIKPVLLFIWAVVYSVIIIRFVFPVWLALVAAIVAVVRRIKVGHFLPGERLFWEKLSLPAFFIAFNLIMIAIISPMPYLRYIAPSVPLLIILAAVIVDAAARIDLIFAVVVVVSLIAGGQLKDYLYEITHDYDGPIEGIVKYLNEHSSPDDVVAITYGDLPLKFYTNLRVVGGLTGEDLESANNAHWVIIRKKDPSRDQRKLNYLLSHTDWLRYRKIVIDYPDICWENREDPLEHRFRTCTDEDKVVIYERIKKLETPKKTKNFEMLVLP